MREHPEAALVITCEHGGNAIPAAYAELFTSHEALLGTHRGFDAGALDMAHQLAAAFCAPLLSATVSRLLVDLNRSIGHPSLHFETVRGLPAQERARVIEHHYQPYRARAEQLVSQAIAQHGRVIHVSSHSFTPVLNGRVRRADVGLQYDPARAGELALCKHWKAAFKACAPAITVRRNYPYAGWNDGLTTSLRKRFAQDAYVGIELELNQKYVLQGGPQWSALREAVVTSLRTALARPDSTDPEQCEAGAKR